MRNILRRPRTRVVVATALAGGLVLGAAAAAHADFNSPRHPTSAPFVASPPSTKAATTAEAATTWQAHDKNCKTVIAAGPVEAGSVCAEVQKRVTASGSVTGCRGRLSVAAAPGQSITPSHYIWSSKRTDYCSGGCTPKTTTWTSSWSPVLTSESTYVAWSPIGGGWEVGASWSQWSKTASRCVTYSAGEVCVNRYDRGYRTVYEERGQLLVKPASGQWIEPRWVRAGHVVNGKSSSKTKGPVRPVLHAAPHELVKLGRALPCPRLRRGLRLRQLGPPLRSCQEHAGRVPLTDLTLSWGGCLSARSSATAHEN